MSSGWEEKAERLSRKLGHTFADVKLLRSAITHRSSSTTNNERLEFLGDSILNFIIAAELYARFPRAREGDLTRMRAVLVKGETVAEISRELGLGEYLSLGAGEQRSGGHQRESILSDALEAVIGALYLDSNVEVCRDRIIAWYESRLNALVPGSSQKDAKTRLQEHLQSRHLPLPEYCIMETMGNAHSPIFKIKCIIAALHISVEGVANSRKKAEQNAAEAALKGIKNDGIG